MSPGSDRRRATFQDNSPSNLNSGRDVVELDVVEDYRARELAARVPVHADEDRGVGDHGVDDRDGLDTLVARFVDTASVIEGDVDADLGVVDVDALEGEAPVPDSVDLTQVL